MKHSRREILRMLASALLMAVKAPSVVAAPTTRKSPNILWIYIEDQNPWYSCYGESLVETPNIDALARDGVLFERAYAASPVCSPSRSAVITGSYPIRLGTHDHRSGRVSDAQIDLPDDVKTVPELFRKAGYATFNRGKDDYNFSYHRSALYSTGGILADHGWKGPDGGGDWRDIATNTPFFGQVQWSGGKYANKGDMGPQLEKIGAKPIDPATVTVPPQYPDIAEIRYQIAQHLGTMLMTDYEVGELVSRLKADGLWHNTVIFLFSDHGSNLPRSKEFCYEEGLHVPLIVVAPGMKGRVPPGTRRRDLTATMDVAATSLALAGLDLPDYMDSSNLFAADYKREYVFSSGDRMSNSIDRVRSVLGVRFHYIRNFLTDRALMHGGYREMLGWPQFIKLRQLYERGALTPAQAAPYGPRPAEELYDLQSDPHEVVNLAGNPAFSDELNRMRSALGAWIEDTDDKGQYPRSKAALREVTDRYPSSWIVDPEFEGR